VSATITREPDIYIQTCIKGVNGITLEDAERIISGDGINCNWWRSTNTISPREIKERLTEEELYLHVNKYGSPHPTRPDSVASQTPFISLTAGAVSRHILVRTNLIHHAAETALQFATNSGQYRGDCFLFYCWVVVGLRPAVPVRHLCEEVRELNTYRRYSAYQTEGEITAKINIPSNQIEAFEHYEIVGPPKGAFTILPRGEPVYNKHDYMDPNMITNIRQAF